MKGFLKLIVVVALVAWLVVEAGSPLWTRPEVAGAAQDAARAGARYLFTSTDLDQARAAAVSAATFRGAKLTDFSQQPDGSVKVTVYRRASPHALDRFSQLKNWYNVKASATAAAVH